MVWPIPRRATEALFGDIAGLTSLTCHDLKSGRVVPVPHVNILAIGFECDAYSTANPNRDGPGPVKSEHVPALASYAWLAHYWLPLHTVPNPGPGLGLRANSAGRLVVGRPGVAQSKFAVATRFPPFRCRSRQHGSRLHQSHRCAPA